MVLFQRACPSVAVLSPYRLAEHAAWRHEEVREASLVVAEGLEVVHLKLGRARLHADEFLSTWSAFVKAHVYTYAIDPQPPHTVHFRWIYDAVSDEARQATTELSLIYSDFLSNLRSALDYLAWQLVLVAGNTPDERQTGFPVADTRQNWNSIRSQKLKGIKGRWVDEIEGLQPFNDANPERHMLYVLNRNNNFSKHQAMQAAILPNLSQEAAIPGYAHPDMPGRQFFFDSSANRPLLPGDEFLRITVDPPISDPDITLNTAPIRILFDDRLDHSDGWDYTNSQLADWVSRAIARFEPAFE